MIKSNRMRWAGNVAHMEEKGFGGKARRMETTKKT
jgi:hypothetical protein